VLKSNESALVVELSFTVHMSKIDTTMPLSKMGHNIQKELFLTLKANIEEMLRGIMQL
jgi:hypothetical protein